MNELLPKPIKVIYAFVDGAHFFTSPTIKGLCAAHSDLQAAYREVSFQLSELLSHEVGRKVVCEPQVEIEEFERWLETHMDAPHTKLRSAALAEWGLKQAGQEMNQS